ncbi:hypothetical protein [Nocardia paucivorans]|uniref:hypothetical protein n=1 Tax=Nocardia paucivorans TaxID=114259 RepID=UPI000300452D|nr:hypothetical protein [Nocardia paucivorans]
MDIDRRTVPGRGVLHHFRTRGGGHFALFTGADHARLYIYDEQSRDDDEQPRDEPALTIPLDPDEADQVADLLYSVPLRDRVTRLERRVDRLCAERGRS